MTRTSRIAVAAVTLGALAAPVSAHAAASTARLKYTVAPTTDVFIKQESAPQQAARLKYTVPPTTDVFIKQESTPQQAARLKYTVPPAADVFIKQV